LSLKSFLQLHLSAVQDLLRSWCATYAVESMGRSQ